VEHHHPDRLGTRLVSNPGSGTSFEQATLPFGNGLPSESTGSTNRRFTSYDRSNVTGLDYAVNRSYDPMQGRFTQVDPIGVKAVSLEHPQTLNLYTYCGNDPVNRLDPDGLFFGRLFRAIGRFFQRHWKAIVAVVVAVAIVLLVPGAASFVSGFVTGGASDVSISSILIELPKIILGSTARAIISASISGAIALGGSYLQRRRARSRGIGGDFPADKLEEIARLRERVRRLLQNPECAAALGGRENAARLLNRAVVRNAQTINVNYAGSGGRYGRSSSFGNLTGAGVARAVATNPASVATFFPNAANVYAVSEVGYGGISGQNIYLNDRFFSRPGPSQQETVFIHELNRLNGYNGTDVDDYARITRACGTADPFGPKQ